MDTSGWRGSVSLGAPIGEYVREFQGVPQLAFRIGQPRGVGARGQAPVLQRCPDLHAELPPRALTALQGVGSSQFGAGR
eukprot:5156682-Lingulodinium_polyedra.AAC.1